MSQQLVPLAVVCEDDIIFHKDFMWQLQHLVLAKLNDDQPVVVFLGGHNDNPGLQLTQFSLVPSPHGSYSNYGYVLNLAAARVLQANFWPITRPEDSYKRYLIAQGLLQAYQVKPSLVAELSSGVNLPAIYSRLSR